MEESEVELDLFPPRTSAAAQSNDAEDAGMAEPATPLSSTLIAKSLKGRTKNGRAMRSWTRNLDHTTVLAVTEGLVYKERFGFMRPDEGDDSSKGKMKAQTTADKVWRSYCKTLTTAQIESQVSFGILRRRIEKFGLARFVAHKDTSQQGIMWTRSQLDDGETAATSSKSQDQGVLQRSSMPQKRFKLLESLRPPFLDGYPLGPLQKLKMWWYSGHYSQVKELRGGYLIERDEDEEDSSESGHSSKRSAATDGTIRNRGSEGTNDVTPPMRFHGAEQEGPWAELSGRKGKGAVYSDQDRNAEEGVLNQLRARMGLPPLDLPSSNGERKGAFAKAVERARIKIKSLLGFDDDEMHAKQQTQGRLERIDRDRTV